MGNLFASLLMHDVWFRTSQLTFQCSSYITSDMHFEHITMVFSLSTTVGKVLFTMLVLDMKRQI